MRDKRWSHRFALSRVGWRVQVTWCRTEECIRRVQECGANEPTFDPEACKVRQRAVDSGVLLL